MLDEDDFLNVIRNAPLVSIDLLVRSPDNGLLFGWRLNEPAAGFWFVPGGRIRKSETIDEAFLRITGAELGVAVGIEHARLLGAFTHRYQTNFAGVEGIGTHYVVLAYVVMAPIDINNMPKAQHSEYRWIYADDRSDRIHENASAYFSALAREG